MTIHNNTNKIFFSCIKDNIKTIMKERYHKQKILFICQNFWPENFRSTDVI